MEKAVVYILQSIKNGTYYVGSTINFENRFKQHNNGLVASTRRLRPFKIMVVMECANETEAKSNECRLKKYKRRDIIEKVIKDKIFPWDYKKRV